MPYGALTTKSYEDKIDIVTSIPFILVHLAALVGAILVPPTAGDIALMVGMYYLRMWGVVVGYHRYLSHRSFSTSRLFQFFLVFLGGTAVQKGGLWWAANHRHHHRYSDQPEDVHSPVQRGFWWSHCGWILARKWHGIRYDDIKDMAKYPELRFLTEHHLVPAVFYAVVVTMTGFAFGGLHGGAHALVWGFLVSTVVLWHGTFTINSLSHVFGRRRFKTNDDSRNSFALSLITLGEGWHNNHHYFPGSMSQGFYWWQVDIAAYTIWALEKVGLVWDVRAPPEKVLKIGRGLVTGDEPQTLAPPLIDPLGEPVA
jgi:stearoyl-CoA desaturase (Delta-9 desaturase)